MNYTTLGKTGLKVSRMGLGCGGHSRLGQATGRSEAESIRIVREAIEFGVNFIDTAEAYGTESIVGKAISDHPRSDLVLSTKVHIEKDGQRSNPEEYYQRALSCLERLQVSYVDILHIHGLQIDHYDYAVTELVPVLRQLQSEGKVRHLGVTEAFAPDPTHKMLSRAAEDDCWEVIMVGFNILNQSARERVLPWTLTKQIGTLDMFAVRKALSNPERLKQVAADLIDQGKIDASSVDRDNPLGFLVAEGFASSVTEAAYRFCLGEPGIDIVLSGTGNLDHLRENFHYLSMPPLPTEATARLHTIFEGIDSVSGN